MISDYRQILDFVKQSPVLYEESTSAFWDDENISKYMLEAHLNPDWDAATRKIETVRKSVAWIASCVDGTEGKKLLDLGCGPGIYAELFNEKGFSVTGVDFSKRSIIYAKNSAKEKSLSIDYHYMNYLDVDYKEEFDVITLIYCDMGVLSPHDRAVVQKNAYNALKPGGILIFDAHTEPYLERFPTTTNVSYEENGFWSQESNVVIERNEYRKDTANTLNQYIVITKEKCEKYNIWNQIYTQKLAVTEVTKAGFSDYQFFDDITGKIYTGKEETLCIMARKKQA